MVKRGRKNTPATTKRARGTSQKCREEANNVVTLEVVSSAEEMPSAPEWFENLEKDWGPPKYKVAKTAYDNFCEQLFISKLLSPLHVDALATLAALQAEVAELLRCGKITSSMITQLRSMYAEFGLTPAAQKAFGQSEPGKKGNKFSGNGHRTRS